VTAPRVLLADDHPLIRGGVRRVLEAGGFSVCAEVADGPAALKTALDLRPDVCLLDIHMPGGGIAAAAAISERLPEAAVVMLTVSRDDGDLFAALRAGASGYLLKDMDPDRLPAALRAILEGEAVLPRSLVARMVDEFDGRGRRRSVFQRGVPEAQRLSSREWEVLRLMREGLSTRQMAERLAISPVTVRRHTGAILTKLRVPDRAAAVRLLEEREG
jgi:DNA-binding NarL/FixJ family response regulator